MALIKCSECGKEVSDKAATCPQCGNPLGKENPSTVVTIQQTYKKWKATKLIGIGLIVIGILSINANEVVAGMLMFLGLVVLVSARIGAWWTNG